MTRIALMGTAGVRVVMGPRKHRALGRVFVGDHPDVIDSGVNYLKIWPTEDCIDIQLRFECVRVFPWILAVASTLGHRLVPGI